MDQDNPEERIAELERLAQARAAAHEDHAIEQPPQMVYPAQGNPQTALGVEADRARGRLQAEAAAQRPSTDNWAAIDSLVRDFIPEAVRRGIKPTGFLIKTWRVVHARIQFYVLEIHTNGKWVLRELGPHPRGGVRASSDKPGVYGCEFDEINGLREGAVRFLNGPIQVQAATPQVRWEPTNIPAQAGPANLMNARAGPVYSAAELLATGQRVTGVLKSFADTGTTARSRGITPSRPEFLDAPRYTLVIELHFPNLAPMAARTHQSVPPAQVPNLAIGLQLPCAVDPANPQVCVVDWDAIGH